MNFITKLLAATIICCASIVPSTKANDAAAIAGGIISGVIVGGVGLLCFASLDANDLLSNMVLGGITFAAASATGYGVYSIIKKNTKSAAEMDEAKLRELLSSLNEAQLKEFADYTNDLNAQNIA